MGLYNELSCEAGSFSHCCNPHRFLQPEVLRLSFPMVEPWVAVCLTPQLFLQVYRHADAGPPGPSAVALPASVLQPLPHPSCPPATSLPCVLSTPAACLCPSYESDECFFFNSLVVRLPYSLIFWQFWLLFVFKFVVVLLLV